MPREHKPDHTETWEDHHYPAGVHLADVTDSVESTKLTGQVVLHFNQGRFQKLTVRKKIQQKLD